MDLFVIRYNEANRTWSAPENITVDVSPYLWHQMPLLSWDATLVAFNCADQPYIADGTAVCEINLKTGALSVIASPSDTPQGFANGAVVYHPDYEVDGNIVLTGDWAGMEQLWRWSRADGELSLVAPLDGYDEMPCVLPDGRIASLWWGRPDNDTGLIDIKVIDPDGGGRVLVVRASNAWSVGISCGRFP